MLQGRHRSARPKALRFRVPGHPIRLWNQHQFGLKRDALIRIDAGSKAEWDDLVRETLAPLVVPIGADLGALTAVRLTRLGNCHRGQTDQWQKLLFLDPEPNLTP